MTDQHPITPPPVNLLHQWWHEASNKKKSVVHYVARKASQWGADRELDACCKWLDAYHALGPSPMALQLRAARRPKSPSLKEQALETLKYPKDFWSEAEVDTIRLALEQLDD